jgi:hypothetical protein
MAAYTEPQMGLNQEAAGGRAARLPSGRTIGLAHHAANCSNTENMDTDEYTANQMPNP